MAPSKSRSWPMDASEPHLWRGTLFGRSPFWGGLPGSQPLQGQKTSRKTAPMGFPIQVCCTASDDLVASVQELVNRSYTRSDHPSGPGTLLGVSLFLEGTPGPPKIVVFLFGFSSKPTNKKKPSTIDTLWVHGKPTRKMFCEC